MKSRIKFPTIMLSVVLTFSACNLPAEGSQWFVSPNGNDDNSCNSDQNPCRTIQQAIDKASPEGVVFVMAGNYQENIIIEDHDLDIRGEGSETTLIDGGGRGAVISITGGTVILGDITISNSSEDEAGVVGEETRLIVNNSLITRNGYGIRVLHSNLTVTNSSLISNSNTGVYIDFSQGGIANSNITGNGRGIVSDRESELNISNSLIGGNLNAGLEIISNSTALISNSAIRDNFGSGVRLIRRIVAIAVDMGTGTPVEGTPHPGPNCPEVTITNSAIHNNVAFPTDSEESLGGGIYNDWCGTIAITNTTISSNQARLGGGIYNASQGVITIINSTVAVNSATEQGGGIYNSGEISILSSIVALNTGTNCNSPIPSLGFNIDSGDSCEFRGNGDQPNTDPLIDSILRNNGGFTLTHQLFSGSPALNAIGGDYCPQTDQRGIDRPQGPACDIGAFESEDSSLTIEIITPEVVPVETEDKSPSLTATQDANCRRGPALVFTAISYLLENETALIVGRNSDSSWWVIEINNESGTCWIWDGTVTVSGNPSDIPVIAIPPTPTPTIIPLTAPTPISPSGDNNCIGIVNLAFSWQAASGNVASYQLAVQRSTTTSSGPFGDYASGETNGLSISKDITCDTLAYYRWRVRAVDNQGNNGPWSNWVDFREYP